MARRNTYDEQVDPFNAGEPTLPWDEPHALEDFLSGDHPDEMCELDTEDYRSPVKQPDSYQAPQTEAVTPAADAPVKPKRSRRSAGRHAQGSTGNDGGHHPQAPAERRRAARRTQAPADPASGQKRKGGHRVLRLLIILFFLGNFVPALISCTVDTLFDSTYEPSHTIDYTPPEPTPEPDDEPEPLLDPAPGSVSSGDPDEQAIADTVNARIATLAPDNAEARAIIAEGLTEEIDFYFERTPEELGMDVDAAAGMILERSSFELDADATATLSDGTGWTYIVGTCPPVYEIGSALNSSLATYLIDNDLYNSDGTLSDEQKTQANAMLITAIEATAPVEDNRSIDLTRQGDSWVIDEEDWTDSLQSLYGIYL